MTRCRTTKSDDDDGADPFLQCVEDENKTKSGGCVTESGRWVKVGGGVCESRCEVKSSSVGNYQECGRRSHSDKLLHGSEHANVLESVHRSPAHTCTRAHAHTHRTNIRTLGEFSSSVWSRVIIAIFFFFFLLFIFITAFFSHL